MARSRRDVQTALAAILLLPFGGCRPRSDLSRRFVLGLYGVEDPKAAPAVAAAGFDAIQTYSGDPPFIAQLSASAARNGLKLLAFPQSLMASSGSTRGWPMAAWYLVDEPDVQKMPPEKLSALDSEVRKWDPGTPRAFVVGDGHSAARYAGSADVIMVDWYPVPHLPLESLGDHVRIAVETVSGKPVWAVLQAMDWRSYLQRESKRPGVGRFPDIAEMRFMSYDAVINGARGLWYFTFTRPDRKTLLDFPELWFAVTEVTREMAAMRPIFQDGRSIPLPFPPNPDGVAARAWRYHGRDYVVIANRRRDVELKAPAELLKESWRPLFEARRDPRELLDARYGAYYLPPYRVMVFESRLWPFHRRLH